ncbi:MAG: dihydroxyacetone kinase subunit [Glaciihabitans sp.]|nr:dihydroxyacetone kinase subunit [Glaciihabitans sp.]
MRPFRLRRCAGEGELTMMLDISWAREWVELTITAISSHHVELTRLDRDIGDGDHGENMERGFSAVHGKLSGLAADATPADLLKLVATTLISTVGGASGPLVGTAYLKASAAVSGLTELDGSAVVDLLTAARDGIVLRGKAEVGDKTMIDAWTPAVDAAQRALDDDLSITEILRAAADAAEAGSASTDPLVARKGRASYLGERAIGHRDPGSVSSALILRAASDALHGNRS